MHLLYNLKELPGQFSDFREYIATAITFEPGKGHQSVHFLADSTWVKPESFGAFGARAMAQAVIESSIRAFAEAKGLVYRGIHECQSPFGKALLGGSWPNENSPNYYHPRPVPPPTKKEKKGRRKESLYPQSAPKDGWYLAFNVERQKVDEETYNPLYYPDPIFYLDHPDVLLIDNATSGGGKPLPNMLAVYVKKGTYVVTRQEMQFLTTDEDPKILYTVVTNDDWSILDGISYDPTRQFLSVCNQGYHEYPGLGILNPYVLEMVRIFKSDVDGLYYNLIQREWVKAPLPGFHEDRGLCRAVHGSTPLSREELRERMSAEGPAKRYEEICDARRCDTVMASAIGGYCFATVMPFTLSPESASWDNMRLLMMVKNYSGNAAIAYQTHDRLSGTHPWGIYVHPDWVLVAHNIPAGIRKQDDVRFLLKSSSTLFEFVNISEQTDIGEYRRRLRNIGVNIHEAVVLVGGKYLRFGASTADTWLDFLDEHDLLEYTGIKSGFSATDHEAGYYRREDVEWGIHPNEEDDGQGPGYLVAKSGAIPVPQREACDWVRKFSLPKKS